MTAASTEALTPAPGADLSRSRAWSPDAKGWAARIAVHVLIYGGILWITANVEQFWADRISLAAIYAIIGLSLNVVLGYVGQVSLGHHGFVGIAAFAAGYYVTTKAGCTVEEGCNLSAFSTALVIAILSSTLAAILLGLVALRIKGLYLALITLTYGFMAETSIFEIPWLTGGGGGMPAPRPKGFETDREFAFICLFFLVVVIFIDWRLVRSKVGRAILSIKNSEAVAASYGVNVTSYKLLAFIISGIFAGLAGGLFAFRAETVVSNDFQFATALLWVLMVVVGGLGNRVGVVVGSAFFALFPFLIELWSGLEHFVEDTIGRSAIYVNITLGALLAVITIVQYQGGIGQQLSPLTRWLGGKKFSMHEEGEGHGGKKHGGLMAKLKLHRSTEAPAQESPAAEPVERKLSAPTPPKAKGSPVPSIDVDPEATIVPTTSAPKPIVESKTTPPPAPVKPEKAPGVSSGRVRKSKKAFEAGPDVTASMPAAPSKPPAPTGSETSSTEPTIEVPDVWGALEGDKKKDEA